MRTAGGRPHARPRTMPRSPRRPPDLSVVTLEGFRRRAPPHLPLDGEGRDGVRAPSRGSIAGGVFTSRLAHLIVLATTPNPTLPHRGGMARWTGSNPSPHRIRIGRAADASSLSMCPKKKKKGGCFSMASRPSAADPAHARPASPSHRVASPLRSRASQRAAAPPCRPGSGRPRLLVRPRRSRTTVHEAHIQSSPAISRGGSPRSHPPCAPPIRLRRSRDRATSLTAFCVHRRRVPRRDR